MFGTEWKVTMIKSNGKERIYIGSKSDVINDFKYTDESFDIKRIDNDTPVVVNRGTEDLDDVTWDIVYYVGRKKVETLKTNLERKLAYALRGTFAKNPIYKMGEVKVKVEKNK